MWILLNFYYKSCRSKSPFSAVSRQLRDVIDAATNSVKSFYRNSVFASVLHDADSHDWSHEKDFFEVWHFSAPLSIIILLGQWCQQTDLILGRAILFLNPSVELAHGALEERFVDVSFSWRSSNVADVTIRRITSDVCSALRKGFAVLSTNQTNLVSPNVQTRDSYPYIFQLDYIHKLHRAASRVTTLRVFMISNCHSFLSLVLQVWHLRNTLIRNRLPSVLLRSRGSNSTAFTFR